MCTIHLGMVKLKGHDQRPFPQTPSVFAPNQKGIIEYAAVHAHGSVYLVPGEGGSAYDHAVGQVVVFAGFCDLGRQAEIVGVELVQVIC